MTHVSDADVEQTRAAVLATALDMVRDGLVVGTAGNVSALYRDLVVITPSGVPYHAMKPSDLPVLRLDGHQVLGDMVPTSETQMHLAAYQEGEACGEPVRAVVHTHATHATALSTLTDVLPAVHYASASCGGQVKVAPYHTYGSPQLAQAAIESMRGRTGVILANHGTLTVGKDLASAYARTANIEWCATVYLLAAAAGTPRLISPQGFAEVVAKLATYGQAKESHKESH